MFAKYMGEDVATAEDAFNVALSECTTEQERQALITETLTALYGDAATEYEKASGAQLDAKDATAENILVQNELADTIEPVTTAWQELKTDALEAIQPVIETVSGVMLDMLGWMKEHPVAMKAIAAAVGVLAIGLGGLAIAAGIYTAAQWAMNSAILANPITWIIVGIIAAIAAVVAIIVVVIEYWDQIVAAVKKAASSIMDALGSAWEWIKGVFSTVADWFSTNVIQPVANFFKGLWDGIVSAATTAWNWICDAISFAVQLVGSILSAAFQIITLPWRFIWENCKEYVFAAWNWIKEKVTVAINAVKSVISKVMNTIKTVFSTVWNAIKSVVSTVWNAIKNAVTTAVNAVKTKVSAVWNSIKSVTSTAFNAVKSVASNVWNGIKNTVSNVVNSVKSKVSSVWNGIKSTTSSVFNSVKSTVTSVWNNIKNAMLKPIEAAKSKIKGIIDSIKGFFSNMKISLPKIKLPHFKISGKLSISPPSVPKLKIDWYKEGGIMTNPTIFGMNGTSLMAGGEAGPEAILPIDKLEGYISGAIEKAQNVVNLDKLAAAIEDLANRPAVFRVGDRDIAMATASANDSVSGLRNTFKGRGLVLD